MSILTIDKPVVKYRGEAVLYSFGIHQRAELFAVDHPMLGQQLVTTSDVLMHDAQSGRIETRNTIYVKEAKQDEKMASAEA